MGMTVEQGRKRITTLAEVTEAFNAYRDLKVSIGADVSGHSFDRGLRGKGYAEYNAADTIVRTFDGKDEALSFYSRYVEVAREIMSAIGYRADNSNAEALESVPEGTDKGEATIAPQIPSQRRRRANAAA